MRQYTVVCPGYVVGSFVALKSKKGVESSAISVKADHFQVGKYALSFYRKEEISKPSRCVAAFSSWLYVMEIEEAEDDA